MGSSCDAMTYYVYANVDCPNRHTSILGRFLLANGLPVILLPQEAILPGDTVLRFDDALMSRVLADADINFLAVVTDCDGVPSPELLDAAGVAEARAILLKAAAAFGQGTCALPPLRDLSTLSESEVADLIAIKLGMFHSTYLENFFSVLRGCAYMKTGGFGAIPSDGMMQRWSRAQHLAMNGSGRGDVHTEGASATSVLAAAPLQLPYPTRGGVLRTNAVERTVSQAAAAGRDTIVGGAASLIPQVARVDGTTNVRGQRYLGTSLGGLMGPGPA